MLDMDKRYFVTNDFCKTMGIQNLQELYYKNEDGLKDIISNAMHNVLENYVVNQSSFSALSFNDKIQVHAEDNKILIECNFNNEKALSLDFWGGKAKKGINLPRM